MTWVDDFQTSGQRKIGAAFQMPQPSGGLAERRARFQNELQDPKIRNRLLALTHAEVGNQGPKAHQAFMETLFNRADARGQSLWDTMHGPYFPQITHQRTSARTGDPRLDQQYGNLLQEVASGSNVANFATGNASGTVGFAGGPQTAAYGGERFGIEGPDRRWAAQVRTAAPAPALKGPASIVNDGIVASRPGLSPPQPAMQSAAFVPPNPSAQSSYNPQTGTMMRPTPGREVISLNGLGPEQTRDTLQAAYDRGNKNMLYVHDENPRVVARPGDAAWTPNSGQLTTGPAFANSFLVSNPDYNAKPLPMADSDPLRGSRYDDGTATGTLPAPPALALSPNLGPSRYNADLVAQAPHSLAPNATPPPEIKSNTQTAALAPPPQLPGAIQSNATSNVVTSDTSVARSLAQVPANAAGASETRIGLSGPQIKTALGGTPQVSPIATTQAAAPNEVGRGRESLKPTPDSAPAPAGIAPPTQVGPAIATPTPSSVETVASPDPIPAQPLPSQPNAYRESSRMALGGPPRAEPDSKGDLAKAPVKPLQALASALLGVPASNRPLQDIGQQIFGGAGVTPPNTQPAASTAASSPGPGVTPPGVVAKGFPQWNLNPSSSGIKWATGGFSGFGAN